MSNILYIGESRYELDSLKTIFGESCRSLDTKNLQSILEFCNEVIRDPEYLIRMEIRCCVFGTSNLSQRDEFYLLGMVSSIMPTVTAMAIIEDSPSSTSVLLGDIFNQSGIFERLFSVLNGDINQIDVGMANLFQEYRTR